MLSAATLASLFHPLTLSSQVFTDLRDVRFNTVGGVVSTAQGPAVFGNASEGETNPLLRWTRSTGAVPMDTPPLSPIEFRPEDVSANGSVFAGRGSGSGDNLFRPSAYRWSLDGDLEEITTNIRDTTFRVRTRISSDGSVVTGFGASAGFRWSEETGTVEIGARMDDVDVISADNPLFFANDLSADGSVIVGMNTLHPLEPGEASRWTAANGLEGLGFLFNWGSEQFSVAAGVSADGSVITGTGFFDPETDTFSEAFRWTEETGLIGLGSELGSLSFATAISADGSLIVGGLGSIHTTFDSEPFVWTAGSGLQRLVDVLANEYGIADELVGWDLGRITHLSRDGRYIVGRGTGPDNQPGDWLVDLGMTPIPEPGTYGAMGAIGLLAIAAWRRRRTAAIAT